MLQSQKMLDSPFSEAHVPHAYSSLSLCAFFSSIILLGGMLVGPMIDHDEHLGSRPS